MPNLAVGRYVCGRSGKNHSWERLPDPSDHQTRSGEQGRGHRRLRADAGRGSTRQLARSMGTGHRHNQAGGDGGCGHGHTEAHPPPRDVPLVLPVPLLPPGPGDETTVR